MYSTYFHEWVCETYTPCGIVYATEVAKTILNKNHLSPSEFIRPFGDFTGKKILVPFGEKSNNEIKNFGNYILLDPVYNAYTHTPKIRE